MRTQVVHQQYLATQVTTADRLQLVVMLYEGAIGFLRQAKECMTAQDSRGKGHYLGKALDIIAELNASLNFQEGRDLAANLFQLYNFMTQHLTRANFAGDAAAVEEVIGLLVQLKEAWQGICGQARKGEPDKLPDGPASAPPQSLGSLVI